MTDLSELPGGWPCYLGAGGTVPVLVTQGAVLRRQQQVALGAVERLAAGRLAGVVPRLALVERGAPAARLVGQAGQARAVLPARVRAVGLQEEE